MSARRGINSARLTQPWHPRRRRGFSLLEVVLSLAILVGAIAVLGELVRLGLDNAAAARDLTQAQLLCESKLAEISAGIFEPQSIQGASFSPEIDPEREWVYSVTLASLDLQGLISATVTVTENVPVGETPREFSLVRWLRDPGVELPSETAAAAQSEEAP